MAELISVIVTTFNREDALDAVLRSLVIQSDRDFEVIVADDGSGATTTKLIDAWKPKFARRLEHIWHADEGFRAAEIRNRAILAARGSYCIFLDVDCIVRRTRGAIRLQDAPVPRQEHHDARLLGARRSTALHA